MFIDSAKIFCPISEDAILSFLRELESSPAFLGLR
jgi:hypothetical protein